MHKFEEKPGTDPASKRAFLYDEDNNYNIQVLDDPLHNTEIVHHLNKCNEENDGGKLETQNVSLMKASLADNSQC